MRLRFGRLNHVRTDAFNRHFRRNAHEVFEIYAIDYSALSGDFWGMPCEAVGRWCCASSATMPEATPAATSRPPSTREGVKPLRGRALERLDHSRICETSLRDDLQRGLSQRHRLEPRRQDSQPADGAQGATHGPPPCSRQGDEARTPDLVPAEMYKVNFISVVEAQATKPIGRCGGPFLFSGPYLGRRRVPDSAGACQPVLSSAALLGPNDLQMTASR